MITYEPATKLISGGTYRIILNNNVIPEFSSRYGRINFSKVFSFSTSWSWGSNTPWQYYASGSGTYDFLGWGENVNEPEDPEHGDYSYKKRFGIFTTFNDVWTGWGYPIDGNEFEMDVVIGSIDNVTEEELESVLPFFYQAVEKQLSPYLKGLADTIRDTLRFDLSKTYHLHIPAGMMTSGNMGMGYAGISFGSISNIQTQITPQSTSDLSPKIGEFYDPYYGYSGVITGTGLVYDLIDSPYDFDADVTIVSMYGGMPGTQFENKNNLKKLFPEFLTEINPQDFKAYIADLKVSGSKTITSAGTTDVAKYESVYVSNCTPSISSSRSYTQYGTVITPKSTVQYVNLPQGFNTSKSIRVEASAGGTGIPSDFNAYNGAYSSSTITINNTSSYNAYYLTSSQSSWTTISPGASATISTGRYFVWIKWTGANGDIRAYNNTTQLDSIMTASGGMRMINAYINGYLMNKITISNGSCLRGDTLVTMADGSYKRLDNIELGDMILAYDWSTMKLGAHEVLKTNKYDDWNWANESVLYTFDDGTELEVMNHHKFYNVEHKCFMNMSEWQIGEHTLKEDGTRPALVSIQDLHERKQHYTLSILGGVNYFANGLISGDSIAPKDIDLTIDYE